MLGFKIVNKHTLILKISLNLTLTIKRVATTSNLNRPTLKQQLNNTFYRLE